MFKNLLRAATGGSTPWLMLTTFLIGMGLAATVTYWKFDGELQKLKAEQAEYKLDLANQAIKDLAEASKRIHDQAVAGQTDIGALRASLQKLKKEFKDAKPLPVDCAPDTVRVRRLEASIDAVNKAIAGSKSGGTVPSDSKAGDK